MPHELTAANPNTGSGRRHSLLATRRYMKRCPGKGVHGLGISHCRVFATSAGTAGTAPARDRRSGARLPACRSVAGPGMTGRRSLTGRVIADGGPTVRGREGAGSAVDRRVLPGGGIAWRAGTWQKAGRRLAPPPCFAGGQPPEHYQQGGGGGWRAPSGLMTLVCTQVEVVRRGGQELPGGGPRRGAGMPGAGSARVTCLTAQSDIRTDRIPGPVVRPVRRGRHPPEMTPRLPSRRRPVPGLGRGS